MKDAINCGFPRPVEGLIKFAPSGAISHIDSTRFNRVGRLQLSARKATVTLTLKRCTRMGFEDFALVKWKGENTVKATSIVLERQFLAICEDNGIPHKKWNGAAKAEATDEQVKAVVSNLIESTQLFAQCTAQRFEYDNQLAKAKAIENAYQSQIMADKLAKDYATKSLDDELEASGLTDEQLKTMRQASKGLYSVQTFSSYCREKHDKHVVLGLRLRNISTGFSKAFGMENWGDAYFRLYDDHCEKASFLQDLINEDATIVFLVPEQVFSHTKKGATAREMQWLLDHPKAMSKVHFVFGAYSTFTKENISKGATPPHTDLGMYIYDYQEQLVCRLFQQLKADLSLPLDLSPPGESETELLEFDKKLQEYLKESSHMASNGPRIEEVDDTDDADETPSGPSCCRIEEID